MFGGRTDDAERSLHNDTWALSLGDAPAWSGVGALDDAAPASDGTMLAVVKDPGSVIRFGGASANGALASGVFDAKTARFLPLGDAPSAQASWGAGAWDPAGQRLMTFGGYGYTDQSQTWSLDLDASAWTDVSSKSAGPEARR